MRVGGGGYSVLTRDARGRVNFEANERCSAGTGETVEGLCTRLGRGLDEAVAAAEASPDGVTVTSRCAVFAKSELTHFANQGESHGRIFKGLFAGVARNVHSLYDKSKVDGPVLLVGHGALIAPVASGIAELSEAAVTVAPEAGAFEALGAAAFAAAAAPVTLPADAVALVRPARSRIARLEPAAAGPGCVRRLDGAGPTPAAGDAAFARPAVLGLDLGSTGSKAALLDLESGATLASVYRRTEGNPVEAAQALVAEVGERIPAPVVAVGLTGSGRDAAAAVFRAAFPDLGERLTVENEIVAHAVAAARLDPDGGRSLSIVEIGGQDAKFINVEGGRVVDADMNRVCSAGTGSFLEEQAQAHGVDDIAEFGRLAARSERTSRPGPDVHGVRGRRGRGGAQRRLLPRGHLRRPPALRGAQLPQPGDGPAAAARPRLLPGQARDGPRPGADGRGCARARRVRAAGPGRHGRRRHRPAGAPRRAERRRCPLPVDLRRLLEASGRRSQGVPVPRPRLRQRLPPGDGGDRRPRRAAQGRERRPVPEVRRRLAGRRQAAARGAEPVPGA